MLCQLLLNVRSLKTLLKLHFDVPMVKILIIYLNNLMGSFVLRCRKLLSAHLKHFSALSPRGWQFKIWKPGYLVNRRINPLVLCRLMDLEKILKKAHWWKLNEYAARSIQHMEIINKQQITLWQPTINFFCNQKSLPSPGWPRILPLWARIHTTALVPKHEMTGWPVKHHTEDIAHGRYWTYHQRTKECIEPFISCL